MLTTAYIIQKMSLLATLNDSQRGKCKFDVTKSDFNRYAIPLIRIRSVGTQCNSDDSEVFLPRLSADLITMDLPVGMLVCVRVTHLNLGNCQRKYLTLSEKLLKSGLTSSYDYIHFGLITALPTMEWYCVQHGNHKVVTEIMLWTH